jgi:hypothetical protein
MREVMLVALTAAVVADSVMAQAPSLRPGPEHTRMGYFAGRWIVDGEYKSSASGTRGKYQGSETCDWFSGGFHLVCRSKGSGPVGSGTGLSIMSYNPAERTYSYHAINSFGDEFFVRGTVDSQGWTFTSEQMVEDEPTRTRITITEKSPTSYTFRMETSTNGGRWTIIDEARATKVGN